MLMSLSGFSDSRYTNLAQIRLAELSSIGVSSQMMLSFSSRL
jgi:hypothetical protein